MQPPGDAADDVHVTLILEAIQLKESLMSSRPTAELDFVQSNEPLATVEVDIDSIPHEFCGYSDIVARGLERFAASARSTATVYVFQTDSVNFHEQTYSAFFAVAGKGDALKLLYAAFESVAGLRVRYSDYTSSRSGVAQFHIQDGLVWQPEDDLSWYSYGIDPEAPLSAQTDVDAMAEEVAESEGADDEVEGSPQAEPLHSESSTAGIQSGVRFRRARSDASVGAIKRSIETIFGLPAGSVKLCGPEGRPLRSDAEVRTLRKRWAAADR